MRKRGLKALAITGAGLIFFTFTVAAQEVNKEIKFRCMGFMEYGEVMSGKIVNDAATNDFGPGKVYLPKTALNFRVEADLDTRLKIVLQPEIQIWYPTFMESWAWAQLSAWRPAQHYSFFIQNGYAQYSFGDAENSPLRMTLGTFLYKYNNEAVNLGEYLFRSGAYPGYLVNEIDFPYTRLTGLRLNSSLFGGSLSQDLLFTMETEIQPLWDWSLTYIAGYNVGKIFDVGAGASLWRVLPANDSLTTPSLERRGDQRYEFRYLNEKGDANYYSFAGTKLMARATFDIKPIFGGLLDGIMGSNDLKIYGEAAVLGLKSIYPYKDTVIDPGTGIGDSVLIQTTGYYDSLMQRIPVMFGINLPTFKLLDLFAIQFEYYGSRFPNKYYMKRYDEIVWPVPGTGGGSDINNSAYDIDMFNYHRDDWKWSIHLNKTITRGLMMKVQIARDHLRHRMDAQDRNLLDETEMMSKPSNWYWVAKAQYDF